MRTATGVTWIAADHHGTAEATVNATTLTATRRRTKPFGDERGTAFGVWPSFMDKGFVGGTKEPDGLTHLGARDYDPSLGMFVSVDPIQDLRVPQQWNGYAYAGNNPGSLSDPSGLSWSRVGDNGTTAPTDTTPPSGCGSANGCEAHNPANPSSDGGSKPTPKKKKSAARRFLETLGGDTLESAKQTLYWAIPGSCLFEGLNGNACMEQALTPETAVDLVGDLAMCVVGKCHEIKRDFGCSKATAECGAHVTFFVATLLILKAGPKVGPKVAPEAAADSGAAATGAATEAEQAARVETPSGARRPACVGNSFSADTLVLLADGTTKRISDIAIGDEVLAADPESSAEGPRAVTQTHRNYDDDLITIQVVTATGATTIRTTAGHPFWDDSLHEWIDAGKLRRGDRLRTPDIRQATVIGVRALPTTGWMYNLTVDNLHTYYVMAGDAPVLVHNTCTTQHIALWLESEGVEEFADNLNAEHLMNDKDWRGTVWTAANVMKYENSGVRVSFSLDGMQGAENGVSSAVGTALSRNARGIGGATDLEIAFFHDAGTLGKVDFYIGGRLQENPY